MESLMTRGAAEAEISVKNTFITIKEPGYKAPAMPPTNTWPQLTEMKDSVLDGIPRAETPSELRFGI